jgi:hypothetical protein
MADIEWENLVRTQAIFKGFYDSMVTEITFQKEVTTPLILAMRFNSIPRWRFIKRRKARWMVQ